MSGLPICILAGGLSTRLRPLTVTLPKPMVPVGGKPFLQLQLEHFSLLGYDRFVLAVSYLWEKVLDHFGNGSDFGWSIEYSVEPEPMGTGGAALWAQPFWGERALIANGDTYLPEDWRRMEEVHLRSGCPATMALVHADECSRFGKVDLLGGRISAFREKGFPGPGWINGGVYLIERTAFEGFKRGESFSLEKDLFPGMAGKIAAYPCDSPFADIGTPESLAEFRERRKWKSEEDDQGG